MEGVCDKAIEAIAKQDQENEVKRNRQMVIERGFCPDCGEKLVRMEAHLGRLWPWSLDPDWIKSCPVHGEIDRGWYGGGW